MPWDYSEKVRQLFHDAVQGKEGTHMGEIANPDGFGEHGSMVCGDALRFFFRVKQHPTDPACDVITEARYLTFGCTSAIAASEALCSLLEEESKTPIEALQVTNQDLINYLGGLPEQKVHCSVMGAEALQASVPLAAPPALPAHLNRLMFSKRWLCHSQRFTAHCESV